MNKKTLINHLQSLIDVLEDSNTILEHSRVSNYRSNVVSRAHSGGEVKEFASKIESEDFDIDFTIQYGIPKTTE